MERNEVFARIRGKAGKVLFAVAMGRDRTKLDIKNETGLSMSTVLSAVEKWERLGYITITEERVPSGGKPHSRINMDARRAIYGISYRAGVLSACAVNLRGEAVGEYAVKVEDPSSSHRYTEEVARGLARKCPPPVAIGLAVNSASAGEMASSLSDLFGAPCLLTSNVVSMAYRLLWQDVPAPLAVIGVGNRIKCAHMGESVRAIDVGSLASPVSASGEARSYESILSVAEVESRLSEKRFSDMTEWEGARALRVRDTAAYSRLLARTLSSLVEMVATLLAPRSFCLFGEYITRGFFERIRVGDIPARVFFERAEREDLAHGAALQALTECVFNQ